MTKTELNKIKIFADKNFYKDPSDQFTVSIKTPAGEDVAVTTVWMDRTGRFPLDDKQAIDEWGLEGVITFVNAVQNRK